MGKAADSASIVALVPYSAEKGKGLCRAASDFCSFACSQQSAHWMSVSFPRWGAWCYFGTLEKSLKFLSWLKNMYGFPHLASADLNLCPFVVVAVFCCCCSSACSYAVEGRVLLSTGGVPGLEPACIIPTALIVPVVGIWCLAQVCQGAAGEERWHWKSPRSSPHESFERRCNLCLEEHCWHQTAAGTAPYPATAGGERDCSDPELGCSGLCSVWDVCLCGCACMYLGAPQPSCCLDPMYTSVSGSKHFIQLGLEDFRLIGNLSSWNYFKTGQFLP